MIAGAVHSAPHPLADRAPMSALLSSSMPGVSMAPGIVFGGKGDDCGRAYARAPVDK